MKNNFSSSNWTGRTNRTIQEAFGPYSGNMINETYEAPTWKDVGKYVAVVCIISILFSLIIL